MMGFTNKYKQIQGDKNVPVCINTHTHTNGSFHVYNENLNVSLHASNIYCLKNSMFCDSEIISIAKVYVHIVIFKSIYFNSVSMSLVLYAYDTQIYSTNMICFFSRQLKMELPMTGQHIHYSFLLFIREKMHSIFGSEHHSLPPARRQ